MAPAAPHRMDRRGLVRRMVLNEICDDFENLDQIILPNVAKYCTRLGLDVGRDEVVDALTELVESGLAKAYNLSTSTARDPFSGELAGMPVLDRVDRFGIYFYRTPKGMDLHISDDRWYPFDDEDNLRSDWKLE